MTKKFRLENMRYGSKTELYRIKTRKMEIDYNVDV